MGESAVRRILKALYERYREGKAILGADFRKWKVRMLVSYAMLIVLMVLLVQVGKFLQHTGRLDWEPSFLTQLGEKSPFTFSTAVFYQTFGTDITLVILIAATAGLAVWMRRPITAWSIALGYIAVDPVVRVGWLLWDRTRPHVLFQGVAAPAFHSFPSGHTAKTLAVYGMLTILWMRASHNVVEKFAALVLLLFIVTAVPLGRLTMGVHWPTDIVGGWIIGLTWLAMLASALRLERPSGR